MIFADDSSVEVELSDEESDTDSLQEMCRNINNAERFELFSDEEVEMEEDEEEKEDNPTADMEKVVKQVENNWEKYMH